MKKTYVNEFLKIVGIVCLVTVLWQLLELIILGEVRPDKIDTMVAGALSMSLYQNLKYWNKAGT